MGIRVSIGKASPRSAALSTYLSGIAVRIATCHCADLGFSVPPFRDRAWRHIRASIERAPVDGGTMLCRTSSALFVVAWYSLQRSPCLAMKTLSRSLFSELHGPFRKPSLGFLISPKDDCTRNQP